MWTRREFEFRWRAPATRFHVVGGASPDRHARIWNVRNRQQELVQALVELRDALVKALDLFGYFLHPREDCLRILTGPLETGDFMACLVALRLQAFGRSDELATFGVQRSEGRKIERDAAIAAHPLDRRQVLSKVSEVEHRRPRIPDLSILGCLQ